MTTLLTWLTQPHPSIKRGADRRGAQLFAAIILLHTALIVVALVAVNLFYQTTFDRSIWSSNDAKVVMIGTGIRLLCYLLLRLGVYRTSIIAYIVTTAAVGLAGAFVSSPNSEIGLLATAVIPVLLTALIFSLRAVIVSLVSVLTIGLTLLSLVPLDPVKTETGFSILLVVAITGTLVILLKRHLDSVESERAQQFEDVAAKYMRIFDSVGDGIYVANEKGDIIEANQSACQHLGYSRDELIGHSVAAISARTDFDFRALIDELRTNNVLSYATTHRRKDGTVYPVELQLTLQKEHGEPLLLAVARDVTERTRYQLDLQKSETRYRELFNSVMEGIGLVDEHEVVIFANPAMARIFEFDSVVDMIGASLLDHIVPESQSFIMQQTAERKQGSTSQYELEIITAKGNRRWIYASITPKIGIDGSYAGALGALLDITERKRAEALEDEVKQKLDRAERMQSLGMLAGGVAHDLNNMLGPVAGYAELLLEQVPPDSKLATRIKRIARSAHDAADVIQDLLTLARRGRYEMEPICLNEVIENYLDSPGFDSLRNRHTAIRVNFKASNSLRKINGSSAHLAKVVMNLISNACEAMPTGGELIVVTEQRELTSLLGGFSRIPASEFVMLRVKDAGVGIAAEDINKLFEPYFSKKMLGQSGSGLGLSVVYGVVKDHDGFYDIFSEPGKGTEFILYFPVTTVAAPDNSPVTAHTNGQGGLETILVVDDQLEQRQLTSEVLQTLGYTTFEAEHGHAAVEFLKKQSVDLVMLDMIMEPGFDGLDTLLAIRQFLPSQRCMIVSGYAETERMKEMLSLGAGPAVKKPFTIEILSKAVRTALTFDISTDITTPSR